MHDILSLFMNKKVYIFLSIIALFSLILLFYVVYERGSSFSYEEREVKNEENNTALSHTDMSSDTQDTHIYEIEADSKDDCSSFETYDEEKKVCYYECNNDTECKDIEKSINQEIGQWTDDNEKAVLQGEKDNNEEKTVTASYDVDNKENITLRKGKAGAMDMVIWKHISAISPEALTTHYIEHFEVFDDKKSDVLAFVDDADGNGKWRIAVNLSGYTSSTIRERNMTIVHELGHIVALNSSQINTQEEESSCHYYFIDEGCAKASSYINEFVHLFWKKGKGASRKEAQGIYTKDDFVTEYAATNAVEDMAESFAYFVIDGKQNGNVVKDKKINFYYSYPDLVSMRETMRKGISSDVIRARKMGYSLAH